MESSIRLPSRNVRFVSRFGVPPRITVAVPIDAVVIPISCVFDSFSLNIFADNRLIRIGDNRQTSIDAIEAFAIWMPVYWVIKKIVTPENARIIRVGISFFSTLRVYFGFLVLFRKRATIKRIPANRNLNVAIAIGVKPSLSIAFTITNELPQKVIKKSMSIILVKLMRCFFILTNLLGSLVFNSVFC